MTGTKTVSNNTKYLVFLVLAGILMVMGFILAPSVSELFEGYRKIIVHPSTLDFDGLQQAGNFGTCFFNSGLLLLMVLLVYKLTNTDIQGVQIAAAMMVLGFSFYGKNILNIWFPVSGVLLYTAASKKPLSSATALAWFATALSPIFSCLAFGTEVLVPNSPLAIVVGAAGGILGGILVGALAGFLPKRHEGFVLFNAGFAAGLAGMLINVLLIALSLGHEKFPYEDLDYVSGQNTSLALLLLIVFAYFIVVGLILGGGKKFGRMIWHRAKGGNFVEVFGFGASLMNMGLIGIIAVAYVFATGQGQLCGPLFGCIFTAVGFAANGVTPRMYLPTMAGVFIMAFLTGGIAGMLGGDAFFTAAIAKASTRGMLLAAIFSCGLAPIVGEYGLFAGLFVGAVHSILVPNVGILHGWMSLYNNGLSLSLIATFFFPIYSKLGGRRKLPSRV